MVLTDFQLYQKDPEMAVAVASIKALTGVIQRSTATTMMELEIALRAAADCLKHTASSDQVSSISLTAGCELFLRHVTRCFLEFNDFEKCKAQLIDRGEVFAQTSLASRNRISELGHNFIRDGMTIFTHGASRVVMASILRAAKTKNFSVLVTEGRHSSGSGGVCAAQLMKEQNIPCTIIPDAAIGYVMETVDMVIVGAEGVVENGGVVNLMGTFTVAMVAKEMHVPFYVAAESYKFARLYPLNQRDFPESCLAPTKDNLGDSRMNGDDNHRQLLCPMRDYTPPQYITLLWTDLGVLTPSAVSDELIKLYH